MQPKHRAPLRFALPGICGLVHRGSDAAPLAFAHGVGGQQLLDDTGGASRLGQAEAVKVFEVHVKPGGSLHLKPLLASPDRTTPRDARFGGAAHCPVTGLTYVALGHAVYSIDAGGKGLRWMCGDAGSPGAADGSAHDVRLAFPSHVACPDPGTLVVKDENGTRKVSLIAPGRCGNVQTMSSSGYEDAMTFFTTEDAEALLTVWPRPQPVPTSPFPCCSSPPSPSPSSAPLTCYSPTGGGGAAYASLGSITGVAVVSPPPCGRTDNTWPSLDHSGDSAAYDHSDCCNRRQVDLLLTDARQDGSFLVHHVTCWRPTHSSAAAAAAAMQTVRVRTVFDSAQVAAWQVDTPAAGAGGVEPEARHSTCSSTTSSCSSARVTTASCGSSGGGGSPGARRSAQYGWVEVEVEPEEAPAAAAARCSPTPAPQSAFAAAASAAAAPPTPPPATAPADPRCPPGGGGVDLSDAPSMDSRELSYSRLPCYSPCCGDNGYGNSGAAVSGWLGAGYSRYYAAASNGSGDGEFDGVWRCGGVRCPVVLPGGLLLLACPLEGQLLLLHLPQLLEVGEAGEAAQEPKPAAAAAACTAVGTEDCKAPAAVGEAAALPLAQRSTSSGSNSHDISSTTGDSSADIDNALCLGAAAGPTAAVPGVLLECSSSDISGGDWRNGGCGVRGCGESGCCFSSGVSNGGAAVCIAAAGGLLPATPVRYHKRRRWECLVEAVATISSIGNDETRPAAASGGCKRARLESDCYAI